MSKAILVIDMPKHCSECPVCEVWEAIPSCEEYYCTIKKKEIMDRCRKPDWCPLKNPPKHMICFGEDDYVDGYNDCLDKILKE